MVLVENLTKTDIADDVKHEYFYRMFKSNISVDSQDGKIEVQSYNWGRKTGCNRWLYNQYRKRLRE